MKAALQTTLREYGQRLLRARDGRGEWRAERAARAALIRDGMSEGEADRIVEAQACVVRAIKRAAACAPGGAAA